MKPEFIQLRTEKAEQIRKRLESTEYAVVLYQLRENIPEEKDIMFLPLVMARAKLSNNETVKLDDLYEPVWMDTLSSEEYDKITEHTGDKRNLILCSRFYEYMNQENRPGIAEGCYGHSASVSDIILIKEKDTLSCYYVDTIGFQELSKGDKII